MTFPEGLTSIGKAAFSGCTGLTSVTFPEGLTSIGEYAFSGCKGLTSVTFPEGLTSIGPVCIRWVHRAHLGDLSRRVDQHRMTSKFVHSMGADVSPR